MNLIKVSKYGYIVLLSLLFNGCCNCRDEVPVDMTFNKLALDVNHTQTKGKTDVKYFRIYFSDSTLFHYSSAGMFSQCDCTVFQSLNKPISLSVASVDSNGSILADVSERFIGTYNGISSERPELFNTLPALINQFPKVTSGFYLYLMDKEFGLHEGELLQVFAEFNDGTKLSTGIVQL